MTSFTRRLAVLATAVLLFTTAEIIGAPDASARVDSTFWCYRTTGAACWSNLCPKFNVCKVNTINDGNCSGDPAECVYNHPETCLPDEGWCPDYE